jgi:hypothetical protein
VLLLRVDLTKQDTVNIPEGKFLKRLSTQSDKYVVSYGM